MRLIVPARTAADLEAFGLVTRPEVTEQVDRELLAGRHRVVDVCSWTIEDQKGVNLMALNAAFASAEVKDRVRAKIDESYGSTKLRADAGRAAGSTG